MSGLAVLRYGTKCCSKCGEEKALEEFQPNPNGKFGRKSTCRVCNRQATKRWREANREKVRSNKRRSWGRHKDRLNQERREKRGDHERRLAREWRLRNPERYRAQVRKYRADNSDRVREWNRRWYEVHGLEWSREWREKNPEKVRAHNHKRRAGVRNPSPETMARIAVLLDEPCAYCQATEKIEIDHIIPLSRGGLHEPDNLAAACQRCNRSKHDRLLHEWIGGVV